MNLRKLLFNLLPILVLIASCNKDDDGGNVTPPRDRQEVYDEDIVEIEDFLSTHFYNYEDFDFINPDNEANDSFHIVFDTIAGDNSDKTPLIDLLNNPDSGKGELKVKTVTDSEGIEYSLYYLVVREGAGNTVHFTDRVHSIYEGMSIPENYVFDYSVTPVRFSLITTATENGVIQGFSEAMVEFKTSSSYTENGDGTTSYHGHGIGAVVIPSGLGYFNSPLTGVDAYTPLVFKFSLLEREIMDHDGDNIPSYLEDLNLNGNIYDDDTDGDLSSNFLDTDDDGDLVPTADEVDYPEPYVINLGDPDPVFADNEFEYQRENNGGVITIRTVVLTDTNGDGLADYLDPDTAIED